MHAELFSRRRAGLVFLLPLLAASSLASTTIYVGQGQPYTTIQSGINAAESGDIVLVGPGAYFENIDFMGKAIILKSSEGVATTIIDGGGIGPAVTFKSGETASSVIQGFTIRHGGSFSDGIGNIYILGSSPSIIGNTITQGNCWDIQSEGSAPMIRANTISATQDPNGNCSFGGGAAILIWGGINGYNEPGVNSGMVLGNTIEDNVESGLEDAGGNGGAGIAVWGGTLLIMNNTIRNNASPGGSGGAINFVNSQGTIIAQNLIYGNSAGCGGGAIATDGNGLYVVNNTIVNNFGAGDGGFSECAAIAQIYPSPDSYGSDNPRDVFINNIISGSSSYPAVNCSWFGTPSLSTQPTFQNNILYNATGPFFGSFCVDVSNSDGNIEALPKFVDPARNDFRLQGSSPAVDHGLVSVIQTFESQTGRAWVSDFGGNPREQHGTGKSCTIDLGAYEYQSPKGKCEVSKTHPGLWVEEAGTIQELKSNR